MSFKQLYQEELAIMCDKMDKRDTFFFLLAKMQDDQKPIPYEYTSDPAIMLNLQEYRTYGGWRKQPLVMLRIQQAAKKSAKNRMRGKTLKDTKI